MPRSPRRPWLAVALPTLAAACAAPEPAPRSVPVSAASAASTSAPPKAASRAPPASSSAPPPASASARATLPRDVPGLPETSELTKLVRPLFRKGAMGRYAHHHEVDTHGTEKDNILRTDRDVECVVRDVTSFGAALVSHVVCTTVAENGRKLEKPALPDDGSGPLPLAFVLFGPSIWGVDVLPTTEEAVAEIVRTPPLLTHPLAPVPVGDTPVRDPKTGELPTTCAHGASRERLTVRGKPVDGFCATTACAATYGPGVDTICFAPGVGVVKRDLTNRAGPTLERVRWKG